MNEELNTTDPGIPDDIFDGYIDELDAPDDPIEEADLVDLPEMDGDMYRVVPHLREEYRIPSYVVSKLIGDKVIYQEAGTGNCVFVNPERTMAEIMELDQPNRSIVPGSRDDAFWWFKTGDVRSNAEEAYICRSPIEAILLYCWLQKGVWKQLEGDSDPEHKYFAPGEQDKNILYVSVSDPDNQRLIDYVKSLMPTRLAMGLGPESECAKRNPDMLHLLCPLDSWSEVWKKEVSDGEYGSVT